MVSKEEQNRGHKRSNTLTNQSSFASNQQSTTLNISSITPIRNNLLQVNSGGNYKTPRTHSSRSGLSPIMSNSAIEYDYFFKILLVGPPQSGKTSIVRRYCNEVFTKDHHTTFGMQNHMKTIPIDSALIRLSIWDSPSDIKFSHQVNFHISTADAIIYVYDSSELKSVEAIE